MRFFALLAFVLILGLASSGCSIGVPISLSPSAMSFGTLYSNVTYPVENASHTQYQVTSGDFEIVGPIFGEGASTSVLGMFSSGNSGYREALENAKRAGADEIMNMRTDLRYYNFLWIYSRVDTVVTGTGIRWKR